MAAAAFAQPGEALAHGTAHEREHRHQREHRHDGEHGQRAHQDDRHHGGGHADHEAGHDASMSHPDALEWSAPDHAHGHAHAGVDDASVRNKVAVQMFAHAVALPEPAMRHVAAGMPSRRAPLAGGDPATGPPPRLRAPPVC